MEHKQLLEIGCEGGSISIDQINFNGIAIFQLGTEENYFKNEGNKQTYTTLIDAWSGLQSNYKQWHMLYPIFIDYQMIGIVKESLKRVKNLNDPTLSYQDWDRLLNQFDLPY